MKIRGTQHLDVFISEAEVKLIARKYMSDRVEKEITDLVIAELSVIPAIERECVSFNLKDGYVHTIGYGDSANAYRRSDAYAIENSKANDWFSTETLDKITDILKAYQMLCPNVLPGGGYRKIESVELMSKNIDFLIENHKRQQMTTKEQN